MTNEKAIQLLHRLSDEQFDGQHGDERREALEMAVRALESNLVKESGDLVQDLVNDCISRKMAIEAFEPEHDTDWYTPRIIEVLEALPSVQPQACDDVISRDDAIMAVKTGALSAATIFGRTDEGATAYYETVKAIKELPSAQPERKKGEWLVDEDGNMECPFCGNTCGFGNYCNECGADLRGE